MLYKLAVVSSFVLAAATQALPASQCPTGDLQCCNAVESSSDEAVSVLLGLLGVIIVGAPIPVGITCSPITVSTVLSHLSDA